MVVLLASIVCAALPIFTDASLLQYIAIVSVLSIVAIAWMEYIDVAAKNQRYTVRVGVVLQYCITACLLGLPAGNRPDACAALTEKPGG